MFKSIIVTVLALVYGTAVALAADSDKAKQDRTHRNIQTGIVNTPVAQPPRAGTGSSKTPSYTNTKTYSSPVRSGGGSSTSHNYNRSYNVPSPSTKSDSKSKK
jgi:hypothetical protein